MPFQPWQLWPSEDDGGAQIVGFERWPSARWQADARKRHTVKKSNKYKLTADSNHAVNIVPNLLNRDFHVDQPNQKSAGDISYFWTRKGWLYLLAILDLHSRRVIGWAVSKRVKRDLAMRALKMAVALRQLARGCVHHMDRGSQYCSHDYQKLLRQHGFRVSMSGKGDRYDNSVVELLWRNPWPTKREAEVAILPVHQLLVQSAPTALSNSLKKTSSHSNEKWLKRAHGSSRKHDRSN